jgi:hypothetical protein
VDAERRDRLARNEVVFREVNERIEKLIREGEWLEPSAREPESLDVLCECGNAECSTGLRIALSEYERVRSEPTHFLVAPGHAIPAIEDVVTSGAEYEVVTKLAGEGVLARNTDPRS